MVWEGRTYRSLSEIAREVTGTAWSDRAMGAKLPLTNRPGAEVLTLRRAVLDRRE
jgi:hypothetical protein